MDAARFSQEALRVREADLIEAERAATADADGRRASVAKASVATEAAAAAAASAAAKAAAHAVKAGRGAATASQRENQAAASAAAVATAEGAAAVAAAAAARELEVRKLEETVARLQRYAEEELSEAKRQLAIRTEEAATAAEERDAWVVRSGEWEWEAGRLAGEVEALCRKAAGLENEVEAAVATARDLEARLREVEDGAAAARGREAELSDQLGVAQVGCHLAVTLPVLRFHVGEGGHAGEIWDCAAVRLVLLLRRMQRMCQRRTWGETSTGVRQRPHDFVERRT